LRLFPRDLPRLTVDPKHEFVFPLTSIGSPMAWSTKGARGSAVSRRNFELKTGAVVVCARNERSTGCWCIERTDAVSRPRGSVPRGKSVCLTWRNAGEAEIADFSRWWLAESRPVRVQPRPRSLDLLGVAIIPKHIRTGRGLGVSGRRRGPRGSALRRTRSKRSAAIWTRGSRTPGRPILPRMHTSGWANGFGYASTSIACLIGCRERHGVRYDDAQPRS
jgi:hypothetical protein